MIAPVYILIRTSGRPEFFGQMYKTIEQQTYKNIVTIVHTDDPRDKYVTGDIIIRGAAYNRDYGNAPYNLYNNRLLKNLPEEPGWIHFMDDDDEYASPEAIEKFVQASDEDSVNVARVERWDGLIFPKKWRQQKSFQTECFLTHTKHRRKSKWWGHKGGDHHYSKQLTQVLPINWIENLIVCKAQEGKGHGRKIDAGGKVVDKSKSYNENESVICLGLVRVKTGDKKTKINQGELKRLPYGLAYKYEQEGKVKITYGNMLRDAKPDRINQFYKF